VYINKLTPPCGTMYYACEAV
nr:RecName: Full=Antiviral protein Y3 [Pleurotus citrinopileatus]P83481.1 RecName: Full=Antiviral protein Yp3 [Pleurotus citrinopileatus]